jgi:hypothetical protein
MYEGTDSKSGQIAVELRDSLFQLNFTVAIIRRVHSFGFSRATLLILRIGLAIPNLNLSAILNVRLSFNFS